MLFKWLILVFVIQVAVTVNCVPFKKEAEGKKRHQESIVIEKEDVEPKELEKVAKEEVVVKKQPEKVQEIVQVVEEKPKRKRVVEEKSSEEKSMEEKSIQSKKQKSMKVESISENKEDDKKVLVEKRKVLPKKEDFKHEVVVEKKERPKKVEEVKEVAVEKEVVKKPRAKKRIIVEEKEEPKKEVVVEKKKKVKVYKPELEEFEDVKPYERKVKPFREIESYKDGKPYEGQIEPYKEREEYVSNMQYKNKVEPYKGVSAYKSGPVYESKIGPYERMKPYSGGLTYENKLQGFKGVSGYKGGKSYEGKLESFRDIKPYESKMFYHPKSKFGKKEKGEEVEEEEGYWGKDKFEDFEEKAKKPLLEFNSIYEDDKRMELLDKGKDNSFYKSEPEFGLEDRAISTADLYSDGKDKYFGFSGKDYEGKLKSYDLFDKPFKAEFEKKSEIGEKYVEDKHYGDFGGKYLEHKKPDLHLNLPEEKHFDSLGPKYGDLGRIDTDLRSKYSKDILPKFENKEDLGKLPDLGHFQPELHHFKEHVPKVTETKYTPELRGKLGDVHSKYEDIKGPEYETHPVKLFDNKVAKTIVIEEKEKVPVKKER